jgi:cytochrome c biogenesis protein CcmG, thiol:disulfide interchange protein DsbE
MEAQGEGHQPSPAQPQRRSPDRVFKWVAAMAAAALIGFVVFVIVRGPSQPSTPGTAALKVPPPPTLSSGTRAPAFSLPALEGGNTVTLSAYRGKPVMVNFFASWCTDCRAELGAVATVARANSGRLAVVGIDSNETSSATAIRLLGAAGATYPVGVDANAKVATAYLVNALPVTYFLNADGEVVGAVLGPQSATSLERWARRLQGAR